MRAAGFAALLAIAGCAGEPEVRRGAGPGRPPVDSKQCHAQLDHLPGLSYRPLPVKRAGPTCGLFGAVQVLNIGVVVKGIGPLSCPMTAGLHKWIREGLQPAARRRLGSEVVTIESYGTYACRPRNNMAGGVPSEHSTANAIDIAGFRLADGRRITVLGDWNGADGDARAFLRDVHKAGCRNFQVVLGPEANAQHRDHLHFDMGRGPYCR